MLNQRVDYRRLGNRYNSIKKFLIGLNNDYRISDDGLYAIRNNDFIHVHTLKGYINLKSSSNTDMLDEMYMQHKRLLFKILNIDLNLLDVSKQGEKIDTNERKFMMMIKIIRSINKCNILRIDPEDIEISKLLFQIIKNNIHKNNKGEYTLLLINFERYFFPHNKLQSNPYIMQINKLKKYIELY